MLRHYVSPTQYDWDGSLSKVEFSYNKSWQESIKTTTILVNYGEDPITYVDMRINGSQVLVAKGFALSINNVISLAKKHFLVAQQLAKVLCRHQVT